MPKNTKKCKVCREVFEKQQPLQMVCTPKCGYEYAKQQKQKNWNKEKKEIKASLRTLQDHLNEFQVIFNRWIRESKEKVCISCGVDLKGKKYDAGHYRSVGNCPELRFESDNIWPQCVYCNRHLHSNAIEYRIGLVKKIGVDRVENLEKNHPPKKYSIPEIVEQKVIYKDKIKNLR